MSHRRHMGIFSGRHDGCPPHSDTGSVARRRARSASIPPQANATDVTKPETKPATQSAY